MRKLVKSKEKEKFNLSKFLVSNKVMIIIFILASFIVMVDEDQSYWSETESETNDMGLPEIEEEVRIPSSVIFIQ